MKIVVLDGYALNPGDLSWDVFAEFGDLTVYERTPPDLVVERASGADILLVNKVVLGEAELSALTDLRYIGVQATGVNVIDLDAAKSHDIVVTNVPAYSTPAVAQHVFALLLEMTRGVGHHTERVSHGSWSDCPDFSFWETPQVELAGKNFGVIGFGDIGQAVSKIALAFEMSVLVHTRSPDPDNFPGVNFVTLENLLSESDFVSLHCPLTATTESLINSESLALMKASAYLINTGRGQLVNESDLASALNEGVISGAGLDVLSVEPPSADNPLLNSRNCIITPHMAWATQAARQRLMDTLVKNLEAFLAGSPQNQVN